MAGTRWVASGISSAPTQGRRFFEGAVRTLEPYHRVQRLSLFTTFATFCSKSSGLQDRFSSPLDRTPMLFERFARVRNEPIPFARALEKPCDGIG